MICKLSLELMKVSHARNENNFVIKNATESEPVWYDAFYKVSVDQIVTTEIFVRFFFNYEIPFFSIKNPLI